MQRLQICAVLFGWMHYTSIPCPMQCEPFNSKAVALELLALKVPTGASVQEFADCTFAFRRVALNCYVQPPGSTFQSAPHIYSLAPMYEGSCLSACVIVQQRVLISYSDNIQLLPPQELEPIKKGSIVPVWTRLSLRSVQPQYPVFSKASLRACMAVESKLHQGMYPSRK